jgi:amidohydrolase
MKLAWLCGVLVVIGCRTAPTPAPAREPGPQASARSLQDSAHGPLLAAVDAAIPREDLIAWRRHLHQNPELSNREVETGRFIADRLREMGLKPQTGIAGHGVKAVIEGGKPGPVVALRADMDALPVTEEVDLPFASKAKGTYEGKTVGVMHACGHDTHVAMLLAAAKALMSVRSELPGKIVLVFQPAEEGAPAGEQPAGAEAMILQGVLENPKVDAIFGLHVFAGMRSGLIGYRRGPIMAAGDRFELVVEGRQAHGSKPWAGIDPIVVGSEIIGALQTIVSRQVDIIKEPAVVTVGQFEAGVRNNIIPDRERLVGTIRTFDRGMQADIHTRVKRMSESIAAAYGARIKLTIDPGYPVTSNSPQLMDQMLPTLRRIAGEDVVETQKLTGSEDFSFYANRVPGVFLFLGVTAPEKLATADSNHSPRFEVDESALPRGVQTLTHLAIDYLHSR